MNTTTTLNIPHLPGPGGKKVGGEFGDVAPMTDSDDEGEVAVAVRPTTMTAVSLPAVGSSLGGGLTMDPNALWMALAQAHQHQALHAASTQPQAFLGTATSTTTPFHQQQLATSTPASAVSSTCATPVTPLQTTVSTQHPAAVGSPNSSRSPTTALDSLAATALRSSVASRSSRSSSSSPPSTSSSSRSALSLGTAGAAAAAAAAAQGGREQTAPKPEPKTKPRRKKTGAGKRDGGPSCYECHNTRTRCERNAQRELPCARCVRLGRECVERPYRKLGRPSGSFKATRARKQKEEKRKKTITKAAAVLPSLSSSSSSSVPGSTSATRSSSRSRTTSPTIPTAASTTPTSTTSAATAMAAATPFYPSLRGSDSSTTSLSPATTSPGAVPSPRDLRVQVTSGSHSELSSPTYARSSRLPSRSPSLVSRNSRRRRSDSSSSSHSTASLAAATRELSISQPQALQAQNPTPSTSSITTPTTPTPTAPSPLYAGVAIDPSILEAVNRMSYNHQQRGSPHSSSSSGKSASSAFSSPFVPLPPLSSSPPQSPSSRWSDAGSTPPKKKPRARGPSALGMMVGGSSRAAPPWKGAPAPGTMASGSSRVTPPRRSAPSAFGMMAGGSRATPPRRGVPSALGMRSVGMGVGHGPSVQQHQVPGTSVYFAAGGHNTTFDTSKMSSVPEKSGAPVYAPTTSESHVVSNFPAAVNSGTSSRRSDQVSSKPTPTQNVTCGNAPVSPYVAYGLSVSPFSTDAHKTVSPTSKGSPDNAAAAIAAAASPPPPGSPSQGSSSSEIEHVDCGGASAQCRSSQCEASKPSIAASTWAHGHVPQFDITGESAAGKPETARPHPQFTQVVRAEPPKRPLSEPRTGNNLRKKQASSSAAGEVDLPQLGVEAVSKFAQLLQRSVDNGSAQTLSQLIGTLDNLLAKQDTPTAASCGGGNNGSSSSSSRRRSVAPTPTVEEVTTLLLPLVSGASGGSPGFPDVTKMKAENHLESDHEGDVTMSDSLDDGELPACVGRRKRLHKFVSHASAEDLCGVFDTNDMREALIGKISQSNEHALRRLESRVAATAARPPPP